MAAETCLCMGQTAIAKRGAATAVSCAQACCALQLQLQTSSKSQTYKSKAAHHLLRCLLLWLLSCGRSGSGH